MKIAFVTYEYPPFIMGGAGIYAKNITEKLAELDVEVTVFTPNINEYKNFKNLKIIPIDLNNNIILQSNNPKILTYLTQLLYYSYYFNIDLRKANSEM